MITHFFIAPIFFTSIVLNDSHSVLLLLKAIFSGGVYHDGQTETTDYHLTPQRGRGWNYSQPIRCFHQHGEVVLPTVQSGSQNRRDSMRAVRKAHCPESGAEAETVLLRCLSKQVVERTSGACKAEGGLYLYMSILREEIHCLFGSGTLSRSSMPGYGAAWRISSQCNSKGDIRVTFKDGTKIKV